LALHSTPPINPLMASVTTKTMTAGPLCQLKMPEPASIGGSASLIAVTLWPVDPGVGPVAELADVGDGLRLELGELTREDCDPDGWLPPTLTDVPALDEALLAVDPLGLGPPAVCELEALADADGDGVPDADGGIVGGGVEM
jgi:hypothetical protein